MKEKIGEVTLCLVPKKKPHKNGKFPLCLRIQWNNSNKYYSTHCEMDEKEWAKFQKAPDTDHPAMVTFRNYSEIIHRLIAASDFSFDNLKVITGKKNGGSIQELVETYSEELRAQNKYSTGGLYRDLKTSLDEFFQKPYPTTRITGTICQNFLRWLSETKKNSSTTVAIKARNLNTILNKAVKTHLITSNPMSGVKKPTGERRDMTVSHSSLKKLIHADKTALGDEYRWLCYWKAIYFGNGINVKDLLRLKPENVNVNSMEIIFVRSKTSESNKRKIHIPLIPELERALEPLSGGKTYLLPDLDEYIPDSEEEYKRIHQTVKNINHHLRKITELLGIPEKITTYTGRHCFATLLQQQNVPIEYISSAMGHSSIKTTQNYLDGYTNEQRKANARLLNI